MSESAFSGRHSLLDPVWNRNRTLRSGYALVEGQAEHHPEGIYYLRFLRGRKRVWQAIGAERTPRSSLSIIRSMIFRRFR
jgi:hypothetical protein